MNPNEEQDNHRTHKANKSNDSSITYRKSEDVKYANYKLSESVTDIKNQKILKWEGPADGATQDVPNLVTDIKQETFEQDVPICINMPENDSTVISNDILIKQETGEIIEGSTLMKFDAVKIENDEIHIKCEDCNIDDSDTLIKQEAGEMIQGSTVMKFDAVKIENDVMYIKCEDYNIDDSLVRPEDNNTSIRDKVMDIEGSSELTKRTKQNQSRKQKIKDIRKNNRDRKRRQRAKMTEEDKLRKRQKDAEYDKTKRKTFKELTEAEQQIKRRQVRDRIRRLRERRKLRRIEECITSHSKECVIDED